MHHEASLEGLTRLLGAEDLTQTLTHESFQSQIKLFQQVGYFGVYNHILEDK